MQDLHSRIVGKFTYLNFVLAVFIALCKKNPFQFLPDVKNKKYSMNLSKFKVK